MSNFELKIQSVSAGFTREKSLRMEPYKGFKALDYAREKTGVEQLESDRVTTVEETLYTLYVDLNESEARASGLFSDNWLARIKVEDTVLARFIGMKADIIKEDKTGEVKRVKITPVFDTVDFLASWANENYPSAWGETEFKYMAE